MRLIFLLAASFASCMLFTLDMSAAESITCDVCVYGGTASGVSAAAEAASRGKAVILIEPSHHLGGLTTGGLGFTDSGDKRVIGGRARAFYRALGGHYKKAESWTFEPSVAEQFIDKLAESPRIRILLDHRLSTISTLQSRIISIGLEPAGVDEWGAPLAKAKGDADFAVNAAVFIDATYEGDLMAAANVSFAVGREGADEYGEPLNGICAKTPKHQFAEKVDPWNTPGDASSGLIPLVFNNTLGTPGAADASVQAYNFRLCFTNKPENQAPIEQPENYDAKTYELLARHLEAMVSAGQKVDLGQLLKIDFMPNGKTDINNNGPVSTDYIGYSADYVPTNWERRSEVWKAHQDYTRGLVYFLAHSPRVPEGVRKQMGAFGLCKDEFADTHGWPRQLYIREARRMVGAYVVTEQDCEHKREAVADPIAMGSYNMDSHNCRRIIQDGEVMNEGDVQVGPKGPYSIPYRAITPKREQCENLLVPVCLSATHIAYGSIRMEPVFMALGQSAAIAACDAIDEKCVVQMVDMQALVKKLRDAGQVLTLDDIKK